jgi:hypothetical protein
VSSTGWDCHDKIETADYDRKQHTMGAVQQHITCHQGRLEQTLRSRTEEEKGEREERKQTSHREPRHMSRSP